MRRREFITLLGSAAAWPLAARAQQPPMPVIGFLSSAFPDRDAGRLHAFREGLSEAGYVEGRNVAIEYRWAHGDSGRLPELASDLIGRRVAVIVTPGGVAAALAAKAATPTIPIVFVIGADPVQAGLVASLNLPGGNVTGITSMNNGLASKQLELLHQLLRRDARFAVLINPANPQSQSALAEVQAAALTMGQQLEAVTASTYREINPAFGDAVQKGVAALLIIADPLLASRPVH